MSLLLRCSSNVCWCASIEKKTLYAHPLRGNIYCSVVKLLVCHNWNTNYLIQTVRPAKPHSLRVRHSFWMPSHSWIFAFKYYFIWDLTHFVLCDHYTFYIAHMETKLKSHSFQHQTLGSYELSDTISINSGGECLRRRLPSSLWVEGLGKGMPIPAYAFASSVGTALRCLRSHLFPTNMMTMLESAWSRSSFNQRSTFS